MLKKIPFNSIDTYKAILIEIKGFEGWFSYVYRGSIIVIVADCVTSSRNKGV
jgi:hypothetical protein